MSAVMERESSSVRAALRSSDPRMALRDAVQGILRIPEFHVSGLIALLDDLADEYEREGNTEAVSALVEALDILHRQASDHAIRSYLDP